MAFSRYFPCKDISSRKRSRRHRIHCKLQYFVLFEDRKCSFPADAEFYAILAREDIAAMAHLLSLLLRLLRRKLVASSRSLPVFCQLGLMGRSLD